MNKVFLIGRLTKDADIKTSQKGTSFATFTLAVSKRNKSEEKTADFITCKAFGKTAEVVDKYFHKGSRMLVEGALNQETWTNKEGGNESRIVVNVIGVEFVDMKSNASFTPVTDAEDENVPF